MLLPAGNANSWVRMCGHADRPGGQGTACRLPSDPIRQRRVVAPERTNSRTQRPSCPWPVALGWKDSWAVWMPMASRPPYHHANGSTVIRFCHSGLVRQPHRLHASRPSVAREKSRNFTPVLVATPRSASESCGTAEVRPQRASSIRIGHPSVPWKIGSMFSVNGEAYEARTRLYEDAE